MDHARLLALRNSRTGTDHLLGSIGRRQVEWSDGECWSSSILTLHCVKRAGVVVEGGGGIERKKRDGTSWWGKEKRRMTMATTKTGERGRERGKEERGKKRERERGERKGRLAQARLECACACTAPPKPKTWPGIIPHLSSSASSRPTPGLSPFGNSNRQAD